MLIVLLTLLVAAQAYRWLGGNDPRRAKPSEESPVYVAALVVSLVGRLAWLRAARVSCPCLSGLECVCSGICPRNGSQLSSRSNTRLR